MTTDKTAARRACRQRLMDMSASSSERVVVLGASAKPHRYAHQAMVELRRKGHQVIPVHPKLADIDGLPVVNDLSQVPRPVETVTMYVGPAISSGLADQLIALKPKRVLFNPGAENPQLAEQLEAAGIATEEACTLVMLATGRF